MMSLDETKIVFLDTSAAHFFTCKLILVMDIKVVATMIQWLIVIARIVIWIVNKNEWFEEAQYVYNTEVN